VKFASRWWLGSATELVAMPSLVMLDSRGGTRPCVRMSGGRPGRFGENAVVSEKEESYHRMLWN
jgi:hypothetical protein